MICSNCGADISSKDTKCPYCGAMQYEASEKKYMNDLYKINSDMDNLDKNVRRYALLSIAQSIGYVLIGTAAALVIGVAIGRFDYKQYNDSRKERNEIQLLYVNLYIQLHLLIKQPYVPPNLSL